MAKSYLRSYIVILALAAVMAASLVTTVSTPARAAVGDQLKAGVLEEPKSLNPWLATDAWSGRVIKLIFEPLYIPEPKTLEMVPWLAASEPVYDPAKMTYTVKLRPAKWSDGSDFTAEDVAYTVYLIQHYKVAAYASKWKEVTKTEAVDKHTVRFTLKKPYAPFVVRTLSTPIVQKKQWQAIAKAADATQKPGTSLRSHELDHPVGTGPFMLRSWRKGVFVDLVANPHFFGRGQVIAGRKLGPHISGILLKIYGTSDAAILALRKGDIDFYWNSIQAGYLDELKTEKTIKLFTCKKSGVYYFGFNLRRKPFSDLAFRRAVATLVDKEFIVKRILQGGGEVMHSMVPPGNVLFSNQDVEKFGYGLSRKARIKKAYQILTAAGYKWQRPPVNNQGEVQLPGQGLMYPDGKPVPDFTILTPPADYDPNRAMSGMMIQGWLRQVGIPAAAQPMSFGALLEKVKQRHDFDCFVLGYGRLSLDPGYLYAFFHSSQDKKRGWNMSGYRNQAYDELAAKSIAEMNLKARQQMVRQMQAMVIADAAYIPLYNPLIVEGVRSDRFRGWVPMIEGIGNLWSLCTIKPVK